MRVLVTGGAGFIGSCVVRMLSGQNGIMLCNLDKLTYAASPEAVAAAARRLAAPLGKTGYGAYLHRVADERP